MAYYTVCPVCGANLDPGEKCDCGNGKEEKEEFFKKHLEAEKGSGQFTFVFSNNGGSYINIKY